MVPVVVMVVLRGIGAAAAGGRRHLRVAITTAMTPESPWWRLATFLSAGDAMSEAAEHSFIRGEHARETWEYENYPEGEIDEMVEIYKDQHGFTEEDARTILTAMTRKPGYKEYFVRHMMVQELGQLPPDEDASPIKNGVITFVSFMVRLGWRRSSSTY